ncbi:MAG: ribonuclease HII [Chloroflexi bacterium]|nr:ribonuclease HII [Chloroflexota bacterium]
MKKLRPQLVEEFKLRQIGLQFVAGVDEAGRGAWAGPVVAAAVILPLERMDLSYRLQEIHDSKMMSPSQRTRGAEQIKQIAIAVGIGEVGSGEVDRSGILTATRKAMAQAVSALCIKPQHLLIDYVQLSDVMISQSAFTKGDVNILSIAAASVIAKVTRDSIMVRYDELHPGYGFLHHKGYGTKEHRTALRNLGPSIIHRQSFAPIRTTSLIMPFAASG